jgi:probable rRNA maturation factor
VARHQGPTDVLAFAAQEELPALANPEATLELGDIIISLDTAARQAAAAGHDLREELLFLASHGLLHLVGWDHPDQASLEAMLARQDRLVAATAVDCPHAMVPRGE